MQAAGKAAAARGALQVCGCACLSRSSPSKPQPLPPLPNPLCSVSACGRCSARAAASSTCFGTAPGRSSSGRCNEAQLLLLRVASDQLPALTEERSPLLKPSCSPFIPSLLDIQNCCTCFGTHLDQSRALCMLPAVDVLPI